MLLVLGTRQTGRETQQIREGFISSPVSKNENADSWITAKRVWGEIPVSSFHPCPVSEGFKVVTWGEKKRFKNGRENSQRILM